MGYGDGRLTYYWGACDNNEKCESWSDFKVGFSNEQAKSDSRHAYGTQLNDGERVTGKGTKWFFALNMRARSSKAKEIVLGHGLLEGMWVPSSSGGQASFSESMHW